MNLNIFLLTYYHNIKYFMKLKTQSNGLFVHVLSIDK